MRNEHKSCHYKFFPQRIKMASVFFVSRMEWYAPLQMSSSSNCNRNHMWPAPPEMWSEDWTFEVEVRERRMKEEQDAKKGPESWEEEVLQRERTIPNNWKDMLVVKRERSMGTK